MTDDRLIGRREALKRGIGGVAAGAMLALDRRLAGGLSPTSQATGLIERPIPSTGEKLPVVGIGTARSYEQAGTPEQMATLRDVLREFPRLGGRVIDTAPSYGAAESIVGDGLEALGNRDKYFIATKVSLRSSGGRDAATQQMEQSARRLHTDRIDLLQIWNVSNPELLIPALDDWKSANRIRYTGITSSFKGQYAELEDVIRKHKLDFLQVDLAIDNRSAQERVIPAAADRGMAVLINLPFGRTRVFQRVQGKPLPDWARDIDATSWAQVFLKYIIGNPTVTAVIPGTATLEYLKDNMGAAHGRVPDAALRRRIEQYFDAL